MNEQNEQFTWVQTHKKLVKFLSDKEARQSELIDLLKASGVTMFNDQNAADETIDLTEIDPFTFFCYIHKYGDERRRKIFDYLCNELDLPVPKSFSGIPSTNALRVWLFPYKKDRTNNEIDRLWSLFHSALNGTLNDEKFEDALKIDGVAQTKMTEVLFYILPEKYFPINGPSKPFLDEVLGINPKFKTWSEYLNILNQIKNVRKESFYEISNEAWLWNEERKRKESKLTVWLELVEQYKTYLKENSNLEEIYKWEAVKHFQETLDLNTEDFANNLKDSLSKSANLLYQNSKGFIIKTVEYFPEEVREMFDELYNESEPIEERYLQFENRAKELQPKVSEKYGKQLNHQQDERTVSFYLTMKYPERYPLYKDEIYQYLVKLIPDEKTKPAGEKLYHYLEIGEKLISTIEDDNELFDLATQNLNDDCYDGEQKWLIFQDILWTNKRQIASESDRNYWVFQSNSSFFNLEEALRDNKLTSWRVNDHKETIKPGDKVILWATGRESGCYALAEVDSDLYEDVVNEDEVSYYSESVGEVPYEQVQLKITHNLANNPITYKQFKREEKLSGLNIENQGTNITATQEEFEVIRELAESKGDAKWKELLDVVSIIDDKPAIRKFFATVEHVINEFNLSADDNVTYASSIKKYIQFTIGSRYVTHLERKSNKVVQGFYVDNVYLNELKSKHPNLNISEKAASPDERDMTWVYLESKDVNIEDFFDGIVALAKKGVEGQSKSQYRYRYPNIHNPWVAKVALDEDLLKKLFKGDMMTGHKKTSGVNYPLNTIFYGPPGTGKTFTTIKRSAEIVEGREIEDYQEAKEIFNKQLNNTIEFITFHQNYSYEDFIQGLRPDTENDKELTFDRVDGVFKKLADKALKNYIDSERPQTKKKSFEDVFNDFVDPLVEGEIEEIEVKMKRVSYFITAVTNRSIEFRKASGDTAHTLSISTIRKMYDAESVLEIQGLSSYYSPLLDKLLEMGKSPGEVETVELKNFVIVIDEINRANISRVFGELITIIEPDKRYGRELHIPARLPSGEMFSVPDNLYIIGTMNTADKSIALLDIALRRRFDFEAMYPKYEIDGKEIYDADVLQKINKRIIDEKGHDFQIGHSYFMSNDISLVQRMNRKVIPLLLEYFMNNEKEVREILTYAGLKIKEGENVWPLEIIGRI